MFEQNYEIHQSLAATDETSSITYCGCQGPAITVETHNPVESEPTESMEECFQKLKEVYCLCEEDIKKFEDLLKSECRESTNEEIKKTKKKLILEKMDFTPHIKKLQKALESFSNPEHKVAKGRTKSNRRYDESFRRSHFIGVSRNGPNWQALICIKKRKTYIGTYETEEEAARAFDLYSLLLHNTSAKTNFGYTKAEIMYMVREFEYHR